MHKKTFHKRDFVETLTALCWLKGGEYIRGGKLNGSAIARSAEVTQPTVSRWLADLTTPDLPAVHNLAKAFGVTIPQMLGDEPIPKIDSSESDDSLEVMIAMLRKIPKKRHAEVIRHFQLLIELKPEDS